jgi:hypothetical protein
MAPPSRHRLPIEPQNIPENKTQRIKFRYHR